MRLLTLVDGEKKSIYFCWNEESALKLKFPSDLNTLYQDIKAGLPIHETTAWKWIATRVPDQWDHDIKRTTLELDMH